MVRLMPLHSKTPSSLASFESRLVLPFWYWLTQVVLEKRPLNGYNSKTLNEPSSHNCTVCPVMVNCKFNEKGNYLRMIN